MTLRWRCTDVGSSATTPLSVSNATYFMLGSREPRNLPRMLTPSTRSPDSDSTAMMVATASYSTALPALRAAAPPSVLTDVTCASTLPMASEASALPRPICRSSARMRACRNGSVTPPTSYSGA